ncbi:Putative membrane protein of ExoQ family, involved in exopolysaccharide production [uncultured Candidatus Thioglobus sp.]|nr:Putative membrane protein of ExoQ family, involved in exopolysaccharide production [uncultured Candidatus Thioglobus sp.]
MKKIKRQQKNLNIHLVSALAILVAIVSPWFDVSISNHSFVKSYVAGIGIGVLALMTLWMRNTTLKTSFHLSWLKISWLSLFILGTLSIFWSVNVDFTITKWMIWFTTLCAFIVGYRLKLDEQTLIKLSWGLLIAAFVIAGIGLLQYWFDPFKLTQATAPASTFGNKNMSTHPIILIWPLALFLLFSNKIKHRQVWLLTISTALLMVFLFYAHTRASWVSVIAEIILIVGFLVIKRNTLREWINWDKNKTYASLSALGLFLLLINFNDQGWAPFWASVAEASSGAASSGQSRFEIWDVAINMIQASPLFGTGLGSWFHNEVQSGFGTRTVAFYQRAHNDLLELGVEVGIVGMVLLLIGAVFLNRAIFKIIKQNNKTNHWFYFLIWVAMSGSFTQMQFSFPYQLAMPALLMGLYLGLVAKQSESFIPAVKTFLINTSAAYHKSIRVFWLVLILIVSAIYVDWVHTYSTLNSLQKYGKIQQVERVIPSIYHLELPNILNAVSVAYFKINQHDEVLAVDEQILKFWPKTNIALYRYANLMAQQKKYDEAFKTVQYLKTISNKGFFLGHILELQIYQITKQPKKLEQAFLALLNQGDFMRLASDSNRKLLLNITLREKGLHQYSKQIRDSYQTP